MDRFEKNEENPEKNVKIITECINNLTADTFESKKANSRQHISNQEGFSYSRWYDNECWMLNQKKTFTKKKRKKIQRI